MADKIKVKLNYQCRFCKEEFSLIKTVEQNTFGAIKFGDRIICPKCNNFLQKNSYYGVEKLR